MFHFIPWNFSISMSREAFQSVNVPLSVVSILMDIFFVFCMLSQVPEQQRLKQPLNVLLGSLVGCNTALHFFTFLFVLSDFIDSLSESDSHVFYYFTAQCLLFTMRASVTSCLWLNVFYYCQIVPAQHPFLILLKRKIRHFVYAALILDKFFFLGEFIVNVAYDRYVMSQRSSYTDRCNVTNINVICYALRTDIWLRLAYFLLSLCVMLASSCATISYLQRHMKSMETSCRSPPHLQSQIRVTITGIVQTLLYFLCLVWLMLDHLAYNVTNADFDSRAYIICTVLSLYSFGTEINLGFGQAVFRQQVILIWQKLLFFKFSMPSAL
ncbi:uncharacterized protein [Salminus brasiliensis]|uniref:uncharacterized protein n=1 Tax=Salminus brasiliensis TaxID=930266 RepID=UPI003B839DCD